MTKLEATMAELESVHIESNMACAEFSRSRAEMDYCQVALPSFFY